MILSSHENELNLKKKNPTTTIVTKQKTTNKTRYI